jgi:hypothetical protein
MEFEVIGAINDVEAVARGAGVKIRAYLRKVYGRGRWRKLKGSATVRLQTARTIRWSCIGTKRMGSVKRELKIGGISTTYEATD